MPAPVKTLPTIPEPQADVTSLLATVKAMKQLIETLLGRRGDLGQGGFGRQIFLTQTMPTGTKEGDLWIVPKFSPGDLGGTFYWSGASSQWIPFTIGGDRAFQ